MTPNNESSDYRLGQTEDTLSVRQLLTPSHSVVSRYIINLQETPGYVDDSSNGPNPKGGSIHNAGCHRAVLIGMEGIIDGLVRSGPELELRLRDLLSGFKTSVQLHFHVG